jgi:hypothetical protein
MSGHRHFDDVAPAGGFYSELEYPPTGGQIGSRGGFMAIVTTAAETQTLGDPGGPGQFLMLYMLTDGGNCVITADSDVDTSGNNVMTFEDANDFLLLYSIRDGTATYRWQIILNNGSVGLA